MDITQKELIFSAFYFLSALATIIILFIAYFLLQLFYYKFIKTEEIKRTPTICRRYNKIVVMNKYGSRNVRRQSTLKSQSGFGSGGDKGSPRASCSEWFVMVTKRIQKFVQNTRIKALLCWRKMIQNIWYFEKIKEKQNLNEFLLARVSLSRTCLHLFHLFSFCTQNQSSLFKQSKYTKKQNKKYF